MPAPFSYPAQSHLRRHGPRGYAQHEAFRPWLRDEFEFRCVFCLRREQWDRASTLEIEHFQATARKPSSELDYDNLLYACSRCNSAKGVREVTDPTQLLLADTVSVEPRGRLVGLTDATRRLIAEMRLNHPRLVHFRRLWLEVVAMANRFAPELYRQLMGYPDDLPNLGRLRPPQGNKRTDGIANSCYERRKRGELPETY